MNEAFEPEVSEILNKKLRKLIRKTGEKKGNRWKSSSFKQQQLPEVH
jgi:hypothetical protein